MVENVTIVEVYQLLLAALMRDDLSTMEEQVGKVTVSQFAKIVYLRHFGSDRLEDAIASDCVKCILNVNFNHH